MSKDKRGELQQHEHSALRDHMLLVLEKNFQLEEQVNKYSRAQTEREAAASLSFAIIGILTFSVSV